MITALVMLALTATLCLPSDQITRQSFWSLRDRWLALSGWLAVALLAVTYWPLALLWAGAMVQWHRLAARGRPEDLFKAHQTGVVWGGICGWYILIALLPEVAVQRLLALLVGIGVLQSAAVVADWHWRAGHNAYFTRGLTGQRGLTGALLAMLTPFTWAVHPLWMLGLLPGLILTDSWLAWLALVAAGGLYWPPSLWATVPACALAAAALHRQSWRARLDRTPRGTSIDGPIQRLWTAALLGVLWVRSGAWRWGAGPDASLNDIVGGMYRYFPHAPHRIISGHVHNEYLEYAYEGGLLAVVAMLGLVIHTVPRLQVGDPWSAAAVAGAVLAGGTLTTKSPSTGLVWLTSLAVIGAR